MSKPINLDPEYLWICLQSIRDSNGNPVMPDFKFVGAKLGIKPHTAYCRWNALKKAMPADGSVDGITTVNAATASSGNKRKRVTKDDDDEVPKSKRGAKAKKELTAKADPEEATEIEDVFEGLEENGETGEGVDEREV